jgi:hypothetical protein
MSSHSYSKQKGPESGELSGPWLIPGVLSRDLNYGDDGSYAARQPESDPGQQHAQARTNIICQGFRTEPRALSNAGWWIEVNFR